MIRSVVDDRLYFTGDGWTVIASPMGIMIADRTNGMTKLDPYYCPRVAQYLIDAYHGETDLMVAATSRGGVAVFASMSEPGTIAVGRSRERVRIPREGAFDVAVALVEADEWSERWEEA